MADGEGSSQRLAGQEDGADRAGPAAFALCSLIWPCLYRIPHQLMSYSIFVC